MPQLILASASPRRSELLGTLGVTFECRPADCDETPRPGEAPAALVQRLARDKAQTVAAETVLPVLAADTVVARGDEIFGKPRSRAHAADMLRRLSGSKHEVLTAVALITDDQLRERLVTTSVSFRELADQEISAYCATGEPDDKAGAYAIQGGAASFVEHLNGSYTGVVGLPLAETLELLRAAAILPSALTGLR